MGRIGCVRCEKSRSDFMARTFVLIAPAHPVLHRISCSYETIPNAPKHYATHQNMSLWSNGADWVRSLRKIPMWLHGTNFYINCTSWPRSAPSFMQLQNDTKCTQTPFNAPKHELRVQWGWLGAFVAIPASLRGTNFCINCTSAHRFSLSFMQVQNHNKCTQTLWNLRKHEFRVQWGGLGVFIAKNPDVTSWHKLLN